MPSRNGAVCVPPAGRQSSQIDPDPAPLLPPAVAAAPPPAPVADDAADPEERTAAPDWPVRPVLLDGVCDALLLAVCAAAGAAIASSAAAIGR